MINGRNKGHQFERDTATKFQKLGFKKASRQLEYQEGFGVDLKGTGIFQVQCKRGRKYASINTIDEVPKVKGKVNILLTKADRKPEMVVMFGDDFFWLVEMLINNGVLNE